MFGGCRPGDGRDRNRNDWGQIHNHEGTDWDGLEYIYRETENSIIMFTYGEIGMDWSYVPLGFPTALPS
jgi:hypothetical protein